jgi:hypothetical protein
VSRGLGDVYKRQALNRATIAATWWGLLWKRWV